MDTLFDSICGGELDLRWTLLGDHVEMMAPSPVLNARFPDSRFSNGRNVDIGPTPTATGASARRSYLSASGTVFMIVRNGCSGPIHANLRQDVSAQLDVPISDLFALADIMIIVLMILAASGFVFAAILLCQVWCLRFIVLNSSASTSSEICHQCRHLETLFMRVKQGRRKMMMLTHGQKESTVRLHLWVT